MIRSTENPRTVCERPAQPGFPCRISALAITLLLTIPAAPAQNRLRADVDIFGDVAETKKAPDVIRPVANLLLNIFGRKSRTVGEAKVAKVEGMEHTLRFHDGRQMRGKLLELTKTEIIWSRVDVTEPLRFGRGDVRRVTLSGVETGDAQMFNQSSATEKKPEPTSLATVKLAGADWLHGEVSSADGQTFSIQLPDSASFSVSREKIGWLYYGKEAVTGFGLELANVEAWTVAGGPVEDAKDGRLRFTKNQFVAKSMVPPKRFEVAFEVPVSAKGSPIGLWFQPYSPRPNSYTTGTVQLTLGESEIERCIYDMGFKREKLTIGADAPPATDGWHRFRIFYDGLDRKVSVLRNGKKVGEWALADEEKQNRVQIRGLCFNRGDQDDLLIGKFRLIPWDGDFAALDKPADGDRLSLPATPAENGKLTAIAGKTLTFSGAEKELKSGTMLTLGEAGAGLADADTLLIFGKSGELSAANLAIKDGKATFRTNFAPQVEVEAGRLATIAFIRKGGEPVVSDVLVFKNGDELPGKLVETANGAALKWRTPTGVEVTIQPDRVAGIRFSVPPIIRKPITPQSVKDEPAQVAKAAPAAATLELRNGDRIPGELVSMSAENMRFKHSILGERDITRTALWNYFTGPVLDGTADWMDIDPNSGGRVATPDRWISLDGAFYTRQGVNNSNEYSYLSRSGMKPLTRYEMRCEAQAFGDNEPYFSISLGSKSGNSQLNLSFSYGELNIHGYSQRGNSRSFSSEVALRDKFADSKRRFVRLFVDSEKGSTTIMCEGLILKKLGGRKEESMTGLGASMSFYSYGSYSPTRLSGIWIGPWNGDLPDAAKEPAPSVALSNGDVAIGEVRTVASGRATLATDVGEFELPLERITTVEFGGVPSTEKAIGRVRLRDGSVLHVSEFRWEADALSAKSAILGDVKFSAAEVSELILSPSALRLVAAPPPKKVEPATVVAPPQ